MKDYTSNGYTVLAPEAGDMDSVEHVEDMLDALTGAMLPKSVADSIRNGSFVANNATNATHATSANTATKATNATHANAAGKVDHALTIGGQTFDGSSAVTVELDVSQIANASRIYYGTEIPTFTANNGDLYVRLY